MCDNLICTLLFDRVKNALPLKLERLVVSQLIIFKAIKQAYLIIMTTLTVRPQSSDQETAIRIFLDALHVEYNAIDDTDETTYLLSTAANVEHLRKSIEQEQKGEVTFVSLDDIWKK